jgi:thiol-disulfide isomerase/thioredoxin
MNCFYFFKTNFLLLIFFSAYFISSCNRVGNKNQENYEIHGYISGLFEGKAVLGKLENGKIRSVDSVMIQKNQFVFKGGHLSTPEVYYLIFDNGLGVVEFFLENSYIEINGDIRNLEKCEIKGSATQSEYSSFLENNSIYEDKQHNIYTQFDSARAKNDTLLLQSLDSTYHTIYNEQIDFIIKYVIQNNKSVVSAFIAARTLMPLINTADLEKVLSNFSPALSESPYIEELTSEITNRRATEIGREAPEIALPDTSGIINSLNNQRGKYVLLDFWASWCGECRIQNKEFAKLVEKYGNKKFVIFAVSLDENRANWKKVIDTDRLKAVHVCSLKGSVSPEAKLFAVKKIPTLLLINPEGIIVLREFTAPESRKFLENIFKK